LIDRVGVDFMIPRGFESLQPLRKGPAFAGPFYARSRLVRLRRVGL